MVLSQTYSVSRMNEIDLHMDIIIYNAMLFVQLPRHQPAWSIALTGVLFVSCIQDGSQESLSSLGSCVYFLVVLVVLVFLGISCAIAWTEQTHR